MSTGKRLAKRSIIGTRVCAPWEDGKFYSGVIHAVKTPGNPENVSCSDNRYSVRFDSVPGSGGNRQRVVSVREYKDSELIGPGFQTVSGFQLLPGQKVYLTFNGREVSGEVTSHSPDIDEVIVQILPPGHEELLELKKKLEEVRLLESRKSARLMDQDTDFARLADMGGDRKRPSSHSIDVPMVQGSRKRRPSTSQDENTMDECTAALVLMHLSCSPHSPNLSALSWSDRPSPPLSDTCSWRSSTPSPPLSDGGSSSFWSTTTTIATDEGIVIDEFDELPRKKKPSKIVFQCTWKGCSTITTTVETIEAHVRNAHLGPRDNSDDDLSDHEEEFYYTEIELGQTSSPPTLSHRDMARPPTEDPEYLKMLKNNFNATNGYQKAGPINIPSGNLPWYSAASSPNSPQKHIKLSPRPFTHSSWNGSSSPVLSLSVPSKLPGSPTRKIRGETKKCRKVYGMENKEMWCTQCKWKKACTRFGD